MTTPLYAAIAALMWAVAVLAVIKGHADDHTRPLAIIFCGMMFFIQLSQHLVFSTGQYESPFFLWVLVYLAQAYGCFRLKSRLARICGGTALLAAFISMMGSVAYMLQASPRYIEFSTTAILGGGSVFYLAVLWAFIGRRYLASR